MSRPNVQRRPFFFLCFCSVAVEHADSKFTSFQRQLNLYQFKRRKGAHAGAFHHPSFRRGQHQLLSKVRRQKVKRDLAVEARAAQRLARASGGSDCGEEDSEHGGLSGRGRVRAAAQADLRPIRRRHHRQMEDDGNDEYASDEDDEFTAAGSRRSALRRRVDARPSTRVGGVGGGIGARYTQDSNSDESSNDDVWPAESNAGGQEQASSGDDDDRLEWGGGYSNWRQQVPGSPERSPRELHHVSTPMTFASQSEYGHSPGGSSGFDRTSSVGSSMASSLSFTSSPSPSDMMFHSSSPYRLNDCDEGGHSDSTSPVSTHSPVGQKGVTTVKEAAAAGTQVSPAQQRQRDNDLSLAAVVDATVSGWGSPHQSSSLPRLEQFGWGTGNLAVDVGGGSSLSDPLVSGMPQHHQSAHGSPHQEDFGFIELFAANWDAGEGTSPSSSSPSSIGSAGMLSSSPGSNNSGGGAGGSSGADIDGASDAFLQEAQAAGVFGGVDEFLVPRSSGGAVGGYGCHSSEYA